MKINLSCLTIFLILAIPPLWAKHNEEITPYKFSTYKELRTLNYQIPQSSRYKLERPDKNGPPLIYYFSKPQKNKKYSIAVLCDGSSTNENPISAIHFHRYFLQELLDLGLGTITLENWGIDGDRIDIFSFVEHYTRTQRLRDHQFLIDYLSSNPPSGWNGKLVFIGTSEGGQLVTTLSEIYADQTLATINFCGAGDWNWQDELWAFIKKMKENAPWYKRPLLAFALPRSKAKLDQIMDYITKDPVTNKEFMRVTYHYHADALQYPLPNYSKITKPFLVVAGTKDSLINSTDDFVNKAKEAGCTITYFRVDGMDHYVRTWPTVIESSFQWLKEVIFTSFSDTD